MIHSRIKINKECLGYRHGRHGVLRQAMRKRKKRPKKDLTQELWEATKQLAFTIRMAITCNGQEK